MVFSKGGSQSADQYDSGMVWDLRQFYERLLASYIVSFKEAEEVDDYPSMLRCLDKWYYSAKTEWSPEKEDEQYVNNLRKRIIDLSNEYEGVWFKKSYKPEPLEKIQNAFQQAKAYLLFKMKSSNAFGKESFNRGLI